MKFSFKPLPPKLPLPRTIEADAQRVYKAVTAGHDVAIHETSSRNTSTYAPVEALKRAFDVATAKLRWLKDLDLAGFKDPDKVEEVESNIKLVDSILDAYATEFPEHVKRGDKGSAAA